MCLDLLSADAYAEGQELHPDTAASQETEDVIYVGTTYSSTATSSAESAEYLHDEVNLNNNRDSATSDDMAALLQKYGPLKFVGNVPTNAIYGQKNTMPNPGNMADPGIVAYEGVSPQRQIVYPTSATIAAPASVPTVVWNSGLVNNLAPLTSYSTCQVPAYNRGPTDHSTREEHLRQMEYHRYMASYYKQLKLNAENALRMQSVHPPELQRKRAHTPEELG